MTRVACLQLHPRVGEPDANRELSVAGVARGVEAGAEIVVLPELVTSGYVFGSREEARAAAIGRDHELFERWAEQARRGPAVVIGGFCEQGPDGALFNSAAVVDGTGVIAIYRKLHLWDREKLWFVAGSEPPPVIEAGGTKIGVLVCYDLEFPEMPRHLALEGAELIAVPTNWPRAERAPGALPSEVVAAMAAAGANGVFVACCDRAGTERGERWAEATVLLDNEGQVAATPDEHGIAIADLDLARAGDKSLGGRADLFADRRRDVYERMRR